MAELRDGTTTKDPRLDRLVKYDERSRQFPIRGLLGADAPVHSKTWGVPGEHLDQGQEGACVGFGVTNELKAYPKAVADLDNGFARERIYWEAQRNDDWPGGSYPGADPTYEGTAVIDGVKVAASLGYYSSYHWAFSVEEIMQAVANEGPVIVGTKWTDDMDHWSPAGLLVGVQEAERGGHCYLLTGLSLKPRLKGHTKLGPIFRIHNSWGNDWCHGGDAFITVEDFEKLLHDNGEAVLPVGRTKTPVATTLGAFPPAPIQTVNDIPAAHIDVQRSPLRDPLRFWHGAAA